MKKKDILQKIAGLTSNVIGGIAKQNLKNNKAGMGMSFATGYLQNRKVGEGINSLLSNGAHIIPGINAERINSEMKKKPISDHIGDRGQIGDGLKNIKKQ